MPRVIDGEMLEDGPLGGNQQGSKDYVHLTAKELREQVIDSIPADLGLRT